MDLIWHEEEQGSPEWLALRKEHWCASETGVLLGLKKNFPKTANQLAQRKRDLIPQIKEDEFSSDAMAWGHQHEPFVREKINKQKKIKFVPKVASRGRFLASLDGYDIKENIILEVKCPYNKNSGTLKDVVKGIIPEDHNVQIQHQLLVTGAAYCLYAVMHPLTKDISIVIVEGDSLMHENIKNKWKAFEPLMLCEPDDLLDYQPIMYDDKADIDELFKLINDSEYKEAKHRYESFKEHEKEITELKNKIKKKYEEPVEGFGIRIRFDMKKSLDKKQLVNDHPGIDLKDYEISKPTKVFQFTGGNE